MSRETPLFLIVNGHPGAGKTRLATYLGRELAIPVVAKDAIKERLFDTLGVHDREWSKRLGHAAIEVMFGQVEALLRAGIPVVLDCPLNRKFDDVRVNAIERTYVCRVFQIVLTGDAEVLYERNRVRANSAERHAGHGGAEMLGEIRTRLHQPIEPVSVSGETVSIDTTDFAGVSYVDILERVRAAIR